MPHDSRRDQWLERTENARRAARFKSATQRVRKIAGGDPQLTDEQRAELVSILTQTRESA